MRLLIGNWTRRLVGGAEIYLGHLTPRLAARGHELAILHEIDAPGDRAAMDLPDDHAAWCVGEMGLESAVRAAREWHPDLVFLHQMLDPAVEEATIGLARSVLFAHAYHGTCVSGSKTFKALTIRPCTRRFGWACLLHYYPHRCGGLNPFTMLGEFHRQGRRQRLLRRHAAIVTASEHMRREFVRHGLAPEQVHKVRHFVQAFDDTGAHPALGGSSGSEGGYRLLFLGRMDLLKGGRTLLDALPLAAHDLGVPLHLTMAGDGPDRSTWERRAATLETTRGAVSVAFRGWLSREAIGELMRATDLLVVPSLWPEPFGQVGPEAGLHGVPAAAFDVGGISEWLEEGINGHLAPGNPPTAAGLATAITHCLHDRAAHARLCEGAIRVARRFDIDRHVAELEQVFTQVATSKT